MTTSDRMGPTDDAIRRAHATQKMVLGRRTPPLVSLVPPLHRPLRKRLHDQRGTVTLPETVLKRWFSGGRVRNLTGLISENVMVVFPAYASSASRRPPGLRADFRIKEVVVSGSQITVPRGLRETWAGPGVVLLDCGDVLVVSSEFELDWLTKVRVGDGVNLDPGVDAESMG